MLAELEYVAVGCSRTPHAADWSSTGLLAYAASHSVALAEETEKGRGPVRVFATLHGHSERVNCVRWLSPVHHPSSDTPAELGRPELLSGGADGAVIVWGRRRGCEEFSATQKLGPHTAPVTCVAGVYLLPSDSRDGESPPIRTLIASASGDSTVNVWERVRFCEQFVLIQSIPFGRGFALGLDFCIPPNATEPVLACGCDDAKVVIFIRKDRKFCRGVSLSGHTDWVRDVQFVREGDDLLLASCSQDTAIRLWRITQQQEQQREMGEGGEEREKGKMGEEEREKGKMGEEGEEREEGELRLKGNTFSLDSGVVYLVTLEAVLMGHDDWVYSVCWCCLPNGCHGTDQSEYSAAGPCLKLLSSSMDKTLILWKPDPLSGVWMEEVRVGEVGGNTLGFYGGLISPCGLLIFAHDYQGGFHLWGKEEQSGSECDGERVGEGRRGLEVWSSLPTIGGHFAAVQGLSWEPRDGAFLLSVSSDQTTRLHAVWQRESEEKLWFEIARPQIHGYDLTCVAMTTSLQYASGADEKVLRVFEAPANFVGNLSKISQKHLKMEDGEIPIGASVPSLGLSNKAVFTCGEEAQEQQVTKNPFADYIPSFKPVDQKEPPVEAHLLQNTLWPEAQKLYGHGYEIYCAAASPDGKYVATACKATKAEHAVVRVWEVGSWKQMSPLHYHTLTVTHLTFSHSSQLLLATSRDRCWSLWKRTDTSDAAFQLCASLGKSSRLHSRVIWTASWSHDNSCFVTGSRDKKVLLWQQGGCEDGGGSDCGDGWRVRTPTLESSHSVTALDFAPTSAPDGRLILAVGLESGHINLHYCSLEPHLEWSLALSLDASLCHTATVKQLSWKPWKHKAEEPHLEHTTLASCSHDNSVKLFKIRFRD